MRGRTWRLGAPRWDRTNAPLIASAVGTLLCILVAFGDRAGWWDVPGLEAAEQAAIDARFALRGPRPVKDDRVVIVGLDERTRAEHPELMQTRRGWASLIRTLSGHNPRVIAIDAFFANPEVNLSSRTVAQVRKALEGLDALSDRPEPVEAARVALAAVGEETRGDDVLAEAIAAAGNVYLGLAFHLEDGEDNPLPAGAAEPFGLAPARYGEAVVIDAPPSRRPLRAEGWVTVSLRPITAGAAGAGFVNNSEESDGLTRRAGLIIEHGGRLYMPLALSLARVALGENTLTSHVVGESFITVGESRHPVEPTGRAWLSYLGPGGTFTHVSAADVMDNASLPMSLEDKIVLVGYTDPFRDLIATPFDPQFPGVEYHATLLHNLLHDELLRYAGGWITVATVALLGLLLTVAQLRRVRGERPWLAAVLAVVLVGAYLSISQLLFQSGLIIEAIAPSASVLGVVLLALSVGLLTEGREKAQLRGVLSQYVQDTVADRILSDPRRAAMLGGVRRELTVLFSDIRGFSRFSEQLEPEVLAGYLNEYFTPMTRIILDDEGLLDKYIGDAVMAVYGAPLEQEDHADRACRSALAMMAAIGPLNEHWKQRGRDVEIAIGIGINSGPMSVGNMGSETRFNYTVMGDAVNLAARLEGLTKDYGVDILVGEAVAEAASSAFVFRELDTVRVKGRAGTARIFELVGTRTTARLSDAQLAQYEQALAAYRDRRWDDAVETLESFIASEPTDGPARVMLRRIAVLKDSCPDDWDGVYEQMTK